MMKKFIFRLETLLKIRKARERSLKRDFEYALQKMCQCKSHAATLQNQIDTLIEEMNQKRQEGQWDLQETYSQILNHLNLSLSQSQATIAAQQTSLQVQQELLKRAINERKIIEKIKEKQYANWRTSENQIEGALLDEISCRKQTHLK